MLMKINKSKYNNKLKKTLIGFISSVIIWYGCNLDKNDRKAYIKEVKRRKVYNNLNNNIVIKLIIIVLYKLNIYYQIRNIIKKGK